MNLRVALVLNASQNHQRWDAQEDFSFTALNLLFKIWILSAQLFNIHAEIDDLVPLLSFYELVFAKGPGTFVDLDDLSQLGVISQLWIDGVKVFGVLADQYSEAAEALSDFISQNLD